MHLSYIGSLDFLKFQKCKWWGFGCSECRCSFLLRLQGQMGSLITHQHKYWLRFLQIWCVCVVLTPILSGFCQRFSGIFPFIDPAFCPHLSASLDEENERPEGDRVVRRFRIWLGYIFSNNCSSNQVLIKPPNGSFLKHRLLQQPIVETVILLVYSLIET